MEALKKHQGLAVPLDRANVDTDQIIPKQFLRKIERTGFGAHLFHDWRFLDNDGKKNNPDFVFNHSRYQGASVLLARDNFGSGSSREHAPWALADFGFKVIIAPSFADIFYNNCFKNSILPVNLSSEEVDALFKGVESQEGAEISADLENQTLTGPDGKTYSFEVDAFRKDCLLRGLDSIGWTEQFTGMIAAYEEKLKTEKPWLA